MDIFFSFITSLIIFSQENFFLLFFLYFIFLFIYCTLSLPGLIIFVVLSGYLFGTYLGYLISIIAITFGSLLFLVSIKYILKYISLKFLEKYSNNISKYISNSTLEYLIILRMIPGPPLMFQNLLLSILNIPIFKFTISTFIGFTPLLFMCSYIGNKFMDIQLIKDLETKDIISFDLLIFILLVISLIFIRIRYKKRPSK